jgi:hypothetical protein
LRRSFTAIVAALSAAGIAAGAQEPAGFDYPVKIVCGEAKPSKVAYGYYFTAINVHNATAGRIAFTYRISLTDLGELPGLLANGSRDTLGPDQSLEIDCVTMRPHVRGQPAFMKGFAIISSRTPLDVVAVYTAASRSDTPVSVLEVERVTGRGMVVTRPVPQDCKLPDLIVGSIAKPAVVTAAGASRIDVSIENIGDGQANSSVALLEDPTGVGGVPLQATMPTGVIPGHSSRSITFLIGYLPRPPATLTVTADYNNLIGECREDNNTKQYQLTP